MSVLNIIVTMPENCPFLNIDDCGEDCTLDRNTTRSIYCSLWNKVVPKECPLRIAEVRVKLA